MIMATEDLHGFTSPYSGIAKKLETPLQIGLPYDSGAGELPDPYPGLFTALWDTGATSSAIKNAIAQQLGLPSIGETFTMGVGGAYRSKRYLASLYLPNMIALPEIALTGCDDSLAISVLIGMDVITLGDFLVNTYKGKTTFSFQMPAARALDLELINNGLPTILMGRNDPCPCGSGKKIKHCCGVR